MKEQKSSQNIKFHMKKTNKIKFHPKKKIKKSIHNESRDLLETHQTPTNAVVFG